MICGWESELWSVGERASCDLQMWWRNKKNVNWNCNVKPLLYNVQHVSALIIGHNQAHARIFNKITIPHNTLLLNWLISQHYSIDESFDKAKKKLDIKIFWNVTTQVVVATCVVVTVLNYTCFSTCVVSLCCTCLLGLVLYLYCSTCFVFPVL
jgi:hypothetical protein